MINKNHKQPPQQHFLKTKPLYIKLTFLFHMERKSYKLEIVNYLLREESHIRKIAEKLNTNHMMVVRKVKELQKENILDFVREGKNKRFFLKKTIEAKNYAFITENYKLIKIIQKYPELRTLIEKIQKNNKVKLAILFGSYAKGIAKKDSDIDIFIETNNLNIKKKLQLINSKLSIKIGRYNKENRLIKEIEKNHVIIKGVELFYEKNKFFK